MSVGVQGVQIEPVGPPTRPLSLARVMDHLRVEHDAEGPEQTLIEAYTDAALVYCGKFSRRQVMGQRYRLTMPGAIGGAISMPHPPLVSVESVVADGVTVDPSAYWVAPHTWPGEVYLRETHQGPVVIEFTAGYTEETLPDMIRQAVLLIVGHWYEHREDVVLGAAPSRVPMAAETLLWMSRTAL